MTKIEKYMRAALHEMKRADQAEARVRALEEACLTLLDAFGHHGSHWDYSMQHGAGCEQCHREFAAKDKARSALSAPRADAAEGPR